MKAVLCSGAVRAIILFSFVLGTISTPVLANGNSYGQQIYSAAPTSAPIHHTIDLGVGRSSIIDLPEPARDTYVAEPGVAHALMQTARRLVITGVADGSTTVLVSADDGRQIALVEVRVVRDMARLEGTLRSALPHSRISVRAAGDTVILSGAVQSGADAARAVDIAAGFVGGPEKVVNAMTLNAGEQVMLKVSVAEVDRSVLKQFGVTADGSWSIGDIALSAAMENPYGIAGRALAGNSIGIGGSDGTSFIRAMEQVGVARLLAEPTLTAISGETANFLVGGEIPIPTGMTCTNNNSCNPTIEFKRFGVSLTFTPVVLGPGRINLRVATEVSSVDNQNQISFDLGNARITVPGFRVRKQETVVELPSGGTLVTAGLIQEVSNQAINGVPGLMNIPILGALFKSRDYQRRETELVITVTPYLARPIEPQKVARPDQGFADAPDMRTVFFNEVNRKNGSTQSGSIPQRFYGHAGFILD